MGEWRPIPHDPCPSAPDTGHDFETIYADSTVGDKKDDHREARCEAVKVRCRRCGLVRAFDQAHVIEIAEA